VASVGDTHSVLVVKFDKNLAYIGG
jgi:hypothetical protein